MCLQETGLDEAHRAGSGQSADLSAQKPVQASWNWKCALLTPHPPFPAARATYSSPSIVHSSPRGFFFIFFERTNGWHLIGHRSRHRGAIDYPIIAIRKTRSVLSVSSIVCEHS
jgi:hypothetical protein